MYLPLFPLPVFLLPEGITRLRIFEIRYLQMVKVASKNNGFAILFQPTNSNISQHGWASWVEIINFDQGEDGVLIIDVKCKNLVHVQVIEADKHGLHFCEATVQAHWAKQEADQLTKQLSESLQHVFDTHSNLKSLYQTTYLEQPEWVISRWLELIPIEPQMKNVFIQPSSFDDAKQLLAAVILKKNTK